MPLVGLPSVNVAFPGCALFFNESGAVQSTQVNVFNYVVNSLYTGNPQTGTFTNSEVPDEMPHNAAFHQGLHCLLR